MDDLIKLIVLLIAAIFVNALFCWGISYIASFVVPLPVTKIMIIVFCVIAVVHLWGRDGR